jgi:hypothetical protein
MRTTKRQRTAAFFDMMSRVGFSTSETETLLKAERALQRWHELECGTDSGCGGTVSVERDEESGKPFRRVQFMAQGGKWFDHRQPCRDMEKAAHKRISSVLQGKSGLSAYIQGDPRGCALYILRDGDVPEGKEPCQYYNRGIAVCY